MRPHPYDREHNSRVGQAFAQFVDHLLGEERTDEEIDQAVGYHVNAVMQAAYDMGVREIEPSLN